jgi:putative aldouronate transport system substrate-binding protein
MKKIVSLILVGVMGLSLLLAGCGGKSNKTDSDKVPDQANRSSVVTPNGTFPVVEKKVTVTFFAPQTPQVEDMYTNEFTTEYEAKTNVHIEWQLDPEGGKNDARILSLASGQYPDAFLNSGVTLSEEMMYGANGVFVELNDLINKYSVHYKKLLSQNQPLGSSLLHLMGKCTHFH